MDKLIDNLRNSNSMSNNNKPFEINNYDSDSSSSNISDIFNSNTYKIEKKDSGRSISFFEEPKESEYINIKKQCLNETAFKILDFSSFEFHTNKKGNEPPIIYDNITMVKEKITIDGVNKATSNNKILLENYKKFLYFLETINNRIINEFSFKYKLKITLNFKTYNVDKSIFNITCNYIVEIPQERPLQFRDKNILFNESYYGLTYLIEEINNEYYNYLEYE